VEANAISKQEYANAVAAQKAAEAEVAAARAGVQTAQINLNYAWSRRRSPAASAARWSPRARWSARARPRRWPGAADQPDVREHHAVGHRRAEPAPLARAGQAEARRRRGQQVKVLLEDGSPYNQPARLLFSDLQVDPRPAAR
jgi:membrane fusion protein (multidrug efflux system)